LFEEICGVLPKRSGTTTRQKKEEAEEQGKNKAQLKFKEKCT
jgi:hypothetical protein